MISDIIERLQALPEFLAVSGAAGFASAADPATGKPRAVPAAFVLRLSESGEPSLTYMRAEQRVGVAVGIVIVARNLQDAKGAEAIADLDALRAAARTALLGWAPPNADPLIFDAGSLLAFKNGNVWWQDSYRTHTDIIQS